MMRVTFADGASVPALGQGTWHMGERRADAKRETAALRLGVDLGLTLIDTAEMYADGGAELVVADAIAGRRDEVFLVTKVLPHNASRRGLPLACARSLKRLRTDRIDLYLLHWRSSVPLAETIAAFEALRAEGKIIRWGVSNFDTAEMEEMLATPGGGACASNQVVYSPEWRGIEFDLLPWCAAHRMPVMAYSPLGQGGGLLRNPALATVARRHSSTPAQVAVAWALRQPGMIVIPKAANPDHVRENAAAAELVLDPSDLAAIDAAFRPPARKGPLEML